MKCTRCGNEEFILTEEAGKLNLQLIGYLIPILFFICGATQYLYPSAWQNILTNMSLYTIKNLGYLNILFAIFLAITIKIFNYFKKRKYRKVEWHKNSRTKATCTKCFKQYYLNSVVEVYFKFPRIKSEIESKIDEIDIQEENADIKEDEQD